MILKVFEDTPSLSRAAADQAATAIRSAITNHGSARVIAATGASQLEFLNALIKSDGLDWKRVKLFHLDEYIGLPSILLFITCSNCVFIPRLSDSGKVRLDIG